MSQAVVSDLVEQISAASSFTEAAQLLVGWARDLTGCQAAMLRFREEDPPGDGWIPALVESGFGCRFLRDEVLIGAEECLCGRVCRGCLDGRFPFFTPGGSFSCGRMQSVADEYPVASLGAIRGRCITEGFESVGIYPIIGEGSPIGCLHLADDTPHKLDPYLETIERACRECGSLLLRFSRGDRRSALIKAVEDVLMPTEPAPVGGLDISVSYTSATEEAHLGGDFYDVLESGDGRTLLIVGDYSGKGIGAAGMAARARYALATCAQAAASLTELLRNAEAMLGNTIPPGRFVTVVLTAYSPEGRLELVSAGHPDPLLMEKSGSSRELEVPHNPPLAAFDETMYRVGEGALTEEQTLLLYTDGVTESRRGGRLFGIEGIAEFLQDARDLPLDDLTAGLCRTSAEFHAPELAGDDRLVLAARRRPAAQ